jgi:cyclase
MLAKRVIPTMLVRGRTLVKGQKFDSWRSIGHALQSARIHAARGVDELCILDISATAEGRGPDLDLVRELSDGCFIPITVGGGVRTLEDINQLLRAGADKVCIRSGRSVIPAASQHFGRQAIVYSLDVGPCADHKAVVNAARNFEELGAGEILLQSEERDGMMQGYDLELIRQVSAAVNIPVIASGGCGTYEHMLQAFKAGADACASGAMFAFTDNTPKGAARFLKSKKIEVRL